MLFFVVGVAMSGLAAYFLRGQAASDSSLEWCGTVAILVIYAAFSTVAKLPRYRENARLLDVERKALADDRLRLAAQYPSSKLLAISRPVELPVGGQHGHGKKLAVDLAMEAVIEIPVVREAALAAGVVVLAGAAVVAGAAAATGALTYRLTTPRQQRQLEASIASRESRVSTLSTYANKEGWKTAVASIFAAVTFALFTYV